MEHQNNINTLTSKLATMHLDSMYAMNRAMKALKIDDANKKCLVGPNYTEDDEYYIIDCTGVDENNNLCVKLRVKRKRT
jgi:glutamine synthetase type III